MNVYLRHLTASLLVIGVLLGGQVHAQVANFPPGTPTLINWADLPDWDGIYEHGGPQGWNDDYPPRAPEQLPPYNAEYRQKLQQRLIEQHRIDLTGRGNTPYTSPRAGVMPGMMIAEFPINVEVNPREVAIWSPVSADPREIYLDGRRHPLQPFASTKGHSIGHWEGTGLSKVLVVDTCCFRPDTPLLGGGPHSDAMHVLERIWSPQPGVLKDSIVVQDPRAFTHPWTTTKTYYRRPTWEEVENDVAENDRPLPAPGQHIVISAAELKALEGASGAAGGGTDAAGDAAASRLGRPALGRALQATDLTALQQASERAGVNQAWESIEISNVQIDANDISWMGGSRFVKFHCTARRDGSNAYCEQPLQRGRGRPGGQGE